MTDITNSSPSHKPQRAAGSTLDAIAFHLARKSPPDLDWLLPRLRDLSGAQFDALEKALIARKAPLANIKLVVECRP